MKRSHESRHESHEERSTRKKTEKLLQCTREIEQELQDIEARRKTARRAQRESADASKADFLRAAAVLQRKIDENNEEAQREQQFSWNEEYKAWMPSNEDPHEWAKTNLAITKPTIRITTQLPIGL